MKWAFAKNQEYQSKFPPVSRWRFGFEKREEIRKAGTASRRHISHEQKQEDEREAWLRMPNRSFTSVSDEGLI